MTQRPWKSQPFATNVFLKKFIGLNGSTVKGLILQSKVVIEPYSSGKIFKTLGTRLCFKKVCVVKI